MASCFRNLPTSYKLLLLIHMTTIIYTPEEEISLKNELKDLVENHPRSYFKTLKSSKGKHLLEYTVFKTPKLNDPFYNISTKVYWVLNDLSDFPKCQYCGKQIILRNVNMNRGYPIGCTATCVMSLESVQNTFKQTCLKKYGVENPYQSDVCKAKITQTLIDRYGVTCPLHANEFKEKAKQTCLDKYGVEHQAHSRSISLKKHKRYKYNDINFDSAPELALYIYLKDHGVDFEYQPKAEFWYTHNNKQHKYMSDFKIGNDYVEIKGSQFLNKETGRWINPFNHKLDALYEAKHQCCLSNNVKILYSTDYKQYLKYVAEKYGKDYVKQFKAC